MALAWSESSSACAVTLRSNAFSSAFVFWICASICSSTSLNPPCRLWKMVLVVVVADEVVVAVVAVRVVEVTVVVYGSNS